MVPTVHCCQTARKSSRLVTLGPASQQPAHRHSGEARRLSVPVYGRVQLDDVRHETAGDRPIRSEPCPAPVREHRHAHPNSGFPPFVAHRHTRENDRRTFRDLLRALGRSSPARCGASAPPLDGAGPSRRHPRPLRLTGPACGSGGRRNAEIWHPALGGIKRNESRLAPARHPHGHRCDERLHRRGSQAARPRGAELTAQKPPYPRIARGCFRLDDLSWNESCHTSVSSTASLPL
jgi:hypothetical protein